MDHFPSHQTPSPLRSLTSLKLCLTIPRVFLQTLFLIDDDVLNVLHCQVITEGVEKDVFQLLQGDPLHVKLQETKIRKVSERGTVFSSLSHE